MKKNCPNIFDVTSKEWEISQNISTWWNWSVFELIQESCSTVHWCPSTARRKPCTPWHGCVARFKNLGSTLVHSAVLLNNACIIYYCTSIYFFSLIFNIMKIPNQWSWRCKYLENKHGLPLSFGMRGYRWFKMEKHTSGLLTMELF